MNSAPDPKLIRLCCDGELSPEQHAQWEQFLRDHPEARPDIESNIHSEQKLRDRVGIVMAQSCCTPESMRRCVCASMAAARPLEEVRRRSVLQFVFADPLRANVLAVAATLAIVAGAVLFGIFGRTIDDVAPPTAGDLIADAALFAEKEHGQLAGGPSETMSQIVPVNRIKAEAILAQLLGGPVEVFDLQEAGYEFVGAGPCRMPIPAPVGHLLYRKTVEPGAPAPLLSIFIVREEGQCRGKLCEGLDRGEWCCVSKMGVKCGHKILRGTDGRLVYFLVCCDDRDVEPVSRQIHLATAVPRP